MEAVGGGAMLRAMITILCVGLGACGGPEFKFDCVAAQCAVGMACADLTSGCTSAELCRMVTADKGLCEPK